MAQPRLTREALQEALKPPNNCQVKRFLDSLDDENRGVFEEALQYDRKDLSAGKLREILVAAGFKEELVPGVDAINDHRVGRRPCRCRG